MKRRALLAVSVSASLLLGGCSSAEAPREQPSSAPSAASPAPSAISPFELLYKASHLPPERVERLQAACERIRTSLAKKNPAFAETELRILQGSDRFTCHLGSTAFSVTAFSQSRYCPDSSGGTIVLAANGINAIPENPALEKYAFLHEFGHHNQTLKGVLIDGDTPTALVQELEAQATCFAGAEMATGTRQDIQTVEDYLERIPTDTVHGAGATQAQAFRNGVNGAVC